jgi:hypothetical protein
VALLPAVEAWKVAGRKFLWWPGGSLLWWWSRSTVELLLLRLLLLELPRLEFWAIVPILLLLRSTQQTLRWGIHHAVVGRSIARTTTADRSRYHLLPLLLINLGNGLHHSLLINGHTLQLIVRQAGKLYQTLLQVDGESGTVQVGLFLIRIDVIGPILRKSVKLARVVEYIMVPLLKVQELLQLSVEQTRR